MIQTLRIPISTAENPTYIKQGDTIGAITLSFDPEDDVFLTEATIKMQLYFEGRQVFNVSNGNGITIVDDKTFRIDSVPANDFPVGELLGDLEITIGGVRFTYFNVVYTIIKEFTV